MFKKVLFGLAIFSIGVGILISNLDLIKAEITFSMVWPIILLLIGVGEIVDARRVTLTSIILLIIGGYFTLYNFEIIDVSFTKIILPAILIIIGLSLIFPRRFDKSIYIEGKSDITITSFFSGVDNKSDSKELKKVSVSVLFGGATLDLRETALKGGKCTCDVTVIFGGTEIIVPGDWDVNTDNLACVFGGVENKRKTASPKNTLYLTGTVAFGGIEIK